MGRKKRSGKHVSQGILISSDIGEESLFVKGGRKAVYKKKRENLATKKGEKRGGREGGSNLSQRRGRQYRVYRRNSIQPSRSSCKRKCSDMEKGCISEKEERAAAQGGKGEKEMKITMLGEGRRAYYCLQTFLMTRMTGRSEKKYILREGEEDRKEKEEGTRKTKTNIAK